MENEMKQDRSSEISALFDGELEEHEVRAAIKASVRDQDGWRMYALISDGLRGDCPNAPDLTAGVMSRLREEPVVLAPRVLGSRTHHHPLLALAASVAGVAVVGWLALAGNPQAPVSGENMAASKPATVASAVTPGLTFVAVRESPAGGTLRPNEKHPVQADLSEYLLAHHAQSPTSHLHDSTQQIRTVAMTAARP
jgi:sigma-E factor negative regulatory protein RseA